MICEHEKQLSSILEFINEKKSELAIISGSNDHDKLSALMTLISEHAIFSQDLKNRQSDVDDAIKIMKKTNASSVQIQMPTYLPAGKSTNDVSLKKNFMTSSMTTSPSKLNKNLNEKNL